MARERPRRILFVQAADPALYPPIRHAAAAMADAGWWVTILSTPQADTGLEAPAHPGVEEIRLRPRLSYRVGGRDYLAYGLAAVGTALRLRPDVVYASDPLGAGPGLLAAWAAGARMVYHEHDSPADFAPGRAPVRWARRRAARSAVQVVFPNAERARIVRAQLGFSPASLKIVWNLPSRRDLPPRAPKPEQPVAVYYHGSITPERLPQSVPEAIARFEGAAVLRIAGYEAPSGEGYVAWLQDRWGRVEEGGLIDWIGALPTTRLLLAQAAQAHIGLALMPMASKDINMAHMAGASNKAFDYMAAEIALVVSDLAGWRAMFVEPGYAVACDPHSVDNVEAVLRRLIEHPGERAQMARLSREKIEHEWYYEAAFSSVIKDLEAAIVRKEKWKWRRGTLQ